MSSASDLSVTSVSLLAQIRDDDQNSDAWRRFVDRYGKRIYEWCLNLKLQPADAEDVTQDVLVKLARHLGSFEYDGQQTFRGWLRRVTENAVIDFQRDQQRKRKEIGSASINELLANRIDQQDLTARLEDAFDLELLELAKARVRQRVEQHRWQAWEMTTIDQISGEKVASALKMKVPTVYSSRYQVQKLIAQEIQQLEGETLGHVRDSLSGTKSADSSSA